MESFLTGGFGAGFLTILLLVLIVLLMKSNFCIMDSSKVELVGNEEECKDEFCRHKDKSFMNGVSSVHLVELNGIEAEGPVLVSTS